VDAKLIIDNRPEGGAFIKRQASSINPRELLPVDPEVLDWHDELDDGSKSGGWTLSRANLIEFKSRLPKAAERCRAHGRRR
jgi:hypothetical protein